MVDHHTEGGLAAALGEPLVVAHSTGERVGSTNNIVLKRIVEVGYITHKVLQALATVEVKVVTVELIVHYCRRQAKYLIGADKFFKQVDRTAHLAHLINQ